ncbi:MAG: GGDEF domain-containing protein [Spirochaetales bacterium]|nr:GGDEF domain-containing protein [Spirochaetales bacterium]
MGNGQFIAALALLPLSVVTLYRFPPAAYESLYRTLIPFTAFGLSVCVVVLIQCVYPRVKNGRVLLLGLNHSLTALLVLASSLLESPLAPLTPVSVFILGTAGTFMSLAGPQTSGGSRLRRMLAAYGIAWTGVFLLLFLFEGTLIDNVLNRVSPVLRSVSVMSLAAGLSFLALRKSPSDYGFGGTIAGTGSLYLFLLHVAFAPASGPFIVLLTGCIGLYLFIGIVLHWFVRLNHRAHYDPLLKIYNRGYADSILEQNPQIHPYSIVLFDIDHFKAVNDTYGHQAGDTVLFEVAQRLQQKILPGGILCRYGGEEIIAFLPGKKAEDAVAVAEECRISVEAVPVLYQGRSIKVTLSGGAAERQPDEPFLSAVVSAADTCLYKAKENGRNRIIGTRQTRPGVKPRLRGQREKEPAGAAKTKGKSAKAARPRKGSTSSGAAGGKKHRANRKGKKPSLVGREWKQTPGLKSQG